MKKGICMKIEQNSKVVDLTFPSNHEIKLDGETEKGLILKFCF